MVKFMKISDLNILGGPDGLTTTFSHLHIL